MSDPVATPILPERLDAFSQLQLADKLARAVADMGYESMTPIQARPFLWCCRAAT
jgi:ATP-dependent RNA helicase RhlE